MFISRAFKYVPLNSLTLSQHSSSEVGESNEAGGQDAEAEADASNEELGSYRYHIEVIILPGVRSVFGSRPHCYLKL